MRPTMSTEVSIIGWRARRGSLRPCASILTLGMGASSRCASSVAVAFGCGTAVEDAAVERLVM
jgi:hypothetical protein